MNKFKIFTRYLFLGLSLVALTPLDAMERDDQERPDRNKSAYKRVRATHTDSDDDVDTSSEAAARRPGGEEDVDTTPAAAAAAASAMPLDITRLAEAFEPAIINRSLEALARLNALCQQAGNRLNEICIEKPQSHIKL